MYSGEIHTGLEQHEDEKMITRYFFLLKYCSLSWMMCFRFRHVYQWNGCPQRACLLACTLLRVMSGPMASYCGRSSLWVCMSWYQAYWISYIPRIHLLTQGL